MPAVILVILLGILLIFSVIYAAVNATEPDYFKGPYWPVGIAAIVLVIGIIWISAGYKNVGIDYVVTYDIHTIIEKGQTRQFIVNKDGKLKLVPEVIPGAGVILDGSKIEHTRYKEWSCGILFEGTDSFELIPGDGGIPTFNWPGNLELEPKKDKVT